MWAIFGIEGHFWLNYSLILLKNEKNTIKKSHQVSLIFFYITVILSNYFQKYVRQN